MTGFRPWRVEHLRLDQRLPRLETMPDEGGVYAVFWWHDLPLGDAEIPVGLLPLEPPAVREVALRAIAPALAHRITDPSGTTVVPPPFGPAPPPSPPPADLPGELLGSLDHIAAAPAPVTEAVSVVICTRDRPESLRRCLESLRRCDPAPHEIIVVDNAPQTDATRAVAGDQPGIVYVVEPRPGLSRARNAGIRASSGTIIAFTDDDVEVHSGWIARTAAAFIAPDVLAVTGLVLPAALDTESQWTFEKGFGGFGQGYAPLTFDSRFYAQLRPWGVPVWRIGAGANMALRRAAFDEVGWFDERLGAGAAGCSEDSELWYRLLAGGWRCRYDPDAVVFHHHRAEAGVLRHQMHEYMKGHVAALLFQHRRHGDRGNLRRLLTVLPGHYVKQIIGGAWYGWQPKHRTLAAELRGCLAGVRFAIRHRNDVAYAATDPSSSPAAR